MPILLGITALISSAALAWKSVTKDTTKMVDDNSTDIILVVAGLLGMYAAYKIISK